MADSTRTMEIIIAATDKTSAALSSAKTGIDSVSSSVSKLDNNVQIIGTLIAGFTTLAASSAYVATKVFEVSAKFETLNAQLKTATGSAAGASLAFDSLQQFAKETPYELSEVVGAFIKLKNLGLDPSSEALRSYGNTASALGKTLNDMIEAVADASVGEFERLKEFGIKARSEGDNVAFTFQGITTTVGKNAAEIEGYLRQIGSVNFATAMSEKMDTLDGKISNLKDAVDAFYKRLGDAGALNASKSAVDALIKSVNILSENIDDVLAVLALTSGGVIAANFTAISTAIRAAAASAAAATGVVGVLGSTLGITAAAFVGYQIGTFFYDMTEGAKEAKLAVDELNESQKLLKELTGQVDDKIRELSKSTGVNIKNLDDFNAKVKDGTLVWDEQTNAWKDGRDQLQVLNESVDKAKEKIEKKRLEDLAALQAQFELAGMTRDNAKEQAELAIATKEAEENTKLLTGETDKLAKKEEDAKDKAQELKLKLLEIASEEKIKTLDIFADIQIAGLEASTKQIEASFASIDNAITSTGDTLSSFWDNLAQGDLGFTQKWKLQDQIDSEEKRRASVFEQQKELNSQTIELNRLRIESMRNGGSMITVNGDGLAPHLEAIMFEVLASIQTRASGEYAAFLLGI